MSAPLKSACTRRSLRTALAIVCLLGATAAGSGGDLGVYAGYEVGAVGVAFSTSTSKSQSSQTQSVGSSIYGEEGVSILAGTGDIRAVGAQIASLGDISLGAGRDILLSSGASSFASSSKSSNAGGFLGVTISPPGFGTEAGVGLSANLNAGTTKQSASGTTHQNTNVSGANVTLYSGRDTVLKGARVEGDDITATVGRDLTIESVRNTGQMSQSGVRLGLAFGGPLNGPLSLSSITPGFDWGKGTTNWVGTQSGLVGTGTVDVYVENHTDLKGGIIASTSCLALPPDGCLSAGGDTKLDTGTLSYEHFNDIEKSQSLSLDLNLNAGLFTGKRSLFDQDGGLPGEWGKPSTKKTGPNVALEGTYDLIDRAQSVKATVGQGTITIRNQEDQTQDLANLNRDPSLSQIITKDERGHLEIYVSDSALKAAFKAVEIAGKTLADAISAVFTELGSQGFKGIAALEEAREAGLIDDGVLKSQLEACRSGRQGFNLWRFFVSPAYAGDGCSVKLKDGSTIWLSDKERDICDETLTKLAMAAGKRGRVPLGCSPGGSEGLVEICGGGGRGGAGKNGGTNPVSLPSNIRTWNEFQAATKGKFVSRADAARGWELYKQANNIQTGTQRSQAAKSFFLKQLGASGKAPKWMNQWLSNGKVPPGYQVDHIKPLSIGGADSPLNMRLLDTQMHKVHHKFYAPWG